MHCHDSMQGVQVFIEIQDEDIGNSNRWGARQPDELVDILVIDYNQAVRTSHRQNYTGMYGFVIMDLNITVFCVENFAEPDCSQCVPGFTGPDCKTNIDDCMSNPCAPHGKCLDGIASFMCNCDPGFTGELCQTIDHCVGIECNGNGLCVNNIDSYICNCSAGFNGSECEFNIDECLSNPCALNGECIDGVHSFICNCDPGFTGELCRTNIDDCEGVNCSGNGECLDGVNSFTCVCGPGYSGRICDIEGMIYKIVYIINIYDLSHVIDIYYHFSKKFITSVKINMFLR